MTLLKTIILPALAFVMLSGAAVALTGCGSDSGGYNSNYYDDSGYYYYGPNDYYYQAPRDRDDFRRGDHDGMHNYHSDGGMYHGDGHFSGGHEGHSEGHSSHH